MIVRQTGEEAMLGRRFAAVRAAVAQHGPPTLAARRAHLSLLERLVKRHADEIATAIDADFGHRSLHETRLVEIFPTLEAIRYARRRLARWMRPERRSVAAYFAPARARVVRQPLGVVGIIVPWNYPLLLAFGPLVAALAAGNRVMLKMSELTPHTARTLERVLNAGFAADHVTLTGGGKEVGKAFAALPFDHLFFTGSTNVGRSVMRAAAANLTPVTLELGGKSPAIVGSDAPLATAAARIMSGKLRNAGQTCVAPDYALVPEGCSEAFIAAARDIVAKRYPAATGVTDRTSIVNEAHYERLQRLIADATAKGATLVPLAPAAHGSERTTRLLPPAVITDVDDTMDIMHEEIFGPLLPLLTYRKLDDAIAYVNARPRPLALYYFGERAPDIEAVITGTTSGGACINDTIVQFAQNALPFGGVGPSGMGAYHGRDGFEAFSHQKPIFEQARISGYGLFEPPYGARFDVLLKLLQR